MTFSDGYADNYIMRVLADINLKRQARAKENGDEYKPLNLDDFSEDKVQKIREEREREIQERINAACIRKEVEEGNLKYSMIPPQYQDAEFSDLVINKDNEVLIRIMTYYVKHFERMRRGICLIGDYGIGKTRIIATTCKKLIEIKNKSVYFATEQSILEEIKKTFNNDSLETPEDIIRRICNHDIIVIDELGTTKNDWELSTIKRIIDGVINNNRRMFATTNYSGNQLLERWGQTDTYKTPKQVLDRMNEAMDLYQIQGESFRNNRREI